MRDEDRKEFADVIRATFDNYHRQPPLGATLRLWWEMLAKHDLAAVRQACVSYIATEPKHPPSIQQLLELLRPKSERLGAEEAWARAVLACDERETVIMNDEIAQAWGVCKPIMDLGDEVGARMAFKEAYARIVAQAQGPTHWWPSIGHDPHKRDTALKEARRAGLLGQDTVRALLPPPSGAAAQKQGDPAGMQRLRAEMGRLQLARAERADEAEARRAAEREAVTARKLEIASVVAQHQQRPH
ncbi:MAG TPA: replicative helicase loader/inhibitor [Rhizobacter sp.]